MKSLPRIIFIYLTLILLLGFSATVDSVANIYVYVGTEAISLYRPAHTYISYLFMYLFIYVSLVYRQVHLLNVSPSVTSK
jgi:hypothetical protein